MTAGEQMVAADARLPFVHRSVPLPTGRRPSRFCFSTAPAATSRTCSTRAEPSRPRRPCPARGGGCRKAVPPVFRRLAAGVFDLPNLRAETAALADFVAAAAGAYGFDAGRVVAVGFSNGANVAASVRLSRPGVLAGAVLLRPMVPVEPAELPDLNGVSLLIAAGEQDPLVPAAQTRRLAELPLGGGAAVTVATQPAGHGLVPGDGSTAAEWVRLRFGTP